jgi:hypothetical protein
MKFPRYIAVAMLAAGMVAGSPAAFAADPAQPSPGAPSSPSVPPSQPASGPLADAISAVHNAPDPSAAVEAYARAKVTAGDAVPLAHAYVERLVALGLPELAEAQARDLTRRRPDDGLAWAVVAYMDARRGNTVDALNDAVIAARLAPDDAFVQRTAGQLIAYYDRNAQRIEAPAPLKAALDDVRKSLSGKDAYARAYRDASEAYADVPETGPAPDAAPLPFPRSSPSAAYASAYYGGGYYAPYTDPFACAYPSYAWWPSWWWWGPSVVIVNRPFFHHRFDHDRFFGHGFNRDGFRGRFDRFDRFDFGRTTFPRSRFDGGFNRGLVNRNALPLRANGFRGQSSFRPSFGSVGRPNAFGAPSRGAAMPMRGMSGGRTFGGASGMSGGRSGGGGGGGGYR